MFTTNAGKDLYTGKMILHLIVVSGIMILSEKESVEIIGGSSGSPMYCLLFLLASCHSFALWRAMVNI